MRQVKEKQGLKMHRIGSKHAFYYACVDQNYVTHIIMYSYNTPICIVSNSGKYDGSKLHVTLNKDTYNYSRTTSKQVGQWISQLHMFTSFGCWLPWSFKPIIDLNQKELTIDYVDYDVVSESVLTNICYAFGYANMPSLELWQVR